MKKVFSFRVFPLAKMRLTEQKYKSQLAEALIIKEYKCPHCRKPWPKTLPKQEQHGVKIEEKLVDELKDYGSPCTFFSIILCERLGVCPMCGGDKS